MATAKVQYATMTEDLLSFNLEDYIKETVDYINDDNPDYVKYLDDFNYMKSDIECWIEDLIYEDDSCLSDCLVDTINLNVEIKDFIVNDIINEIKCRLK